MMWKLYNKLFGWDYIAWGNFADDGISRVYKDGRGIVYYWRYKSSSIADKVTRVDQVIWLTCPPNKYFGEVTK